MNSGILLSDDRPGVGMADVQLENGYTRIANGIIEALAKTELCQEEWKVLLVLIRKTYGYSKIEDRIGANQFCLLTGLDRRQVWRAIDKLKKRNIIVVNNDDYVNKYLLQKDYDKWIDTGSDSRVTSDSGVTRTSDSGVTRTSDSGVTHKRKKARNKVVDDDMVISSSTLEAKKTPSEFTIAKNYVMDIFLRETGMQLPLSRKSLGIWWGPITEILAICNKDKDRAGELVKSAIWEMRKKNLDIYTPNSILKTCGKLAATNTRGRIGEDGGLRL
jgi:phage replication O-like protein O